MTLYVPGESMNAYKTTAPWSGFGKFQTLTTGIEKTETAAKPMITTADIYTPDGRLVASHLCSSSADRLSVQKGAYLVKVLGNTTKVIVY